ncbi:DUF4123 domain-containing protein [Niabella insulamsoli]|uniref:DUF4123 domain-containing protein n=1 Tax=Niabella insulamsoli TaxID=3144874 RepID=UPI0031FC4E5D
MKYLCFDSALNEAFTLIKLMERYKQHVSLFAGTDDEGIWEAAPWLFLAEDNFYEMQEELLVQLNHCIVFETDESMKDVCDFLHTKMYRTDQDQSRYFRIWDARVLLRFLQSCSATEQLVFSQVFDAFYTEADQQRLFRWNLKSGRLIAETVSKSEALPAVKPLEAERDETNDNRF